MTYLADHSTAPLACTECNFTSTDIHLLLKHSCDIQKQGGRCEDYPCCGHEAGDCNGLLYGSDEAIKAQVELHSGCEHEHGYCRLEDEDNEDDDIYDEVAFYGSDY